ncbi:Uncharacterised protein [Mycobacteroides abscessus]|nr:Uncharacterised protein [Mycobacteroides abscessus]
MREQHDRAVETGERVDDRRHPRRVVRVLGAVDRREVEAAGLEPELGEQRDAAVGDRVPDLEQDVGHHVADEDGSRPQPFGREVVHRDLRRCEAQVGGVVREDAVVLLGHAPVEGPQARLEVRERDVQLDRRPRGGERRVGVAVREDPVGPVLVEHGVEGAEDRARLHAVAAGPDAQVHVRVGDPEVAEEHVGQHRVVVLTRVDDDVLGSCCRGRLRDRGELDELRTRTDDAEDLHERRC